MPQQILQVNLKFSIPRADLAGAWLGVAKPIADTPGLAWKVWLMNEAEHEAGNPLADDLSQERAEEAGIAAIRSNHAHAECHLTQGLAAQRQHAAVVGG